VEPDEEGLQALVAEVLDAHSQRVGTLHFSVYSRTGMCSLCGVPLLSTQGDGMLTRI
jgi:hypothetical protein